MAKKKTRRQAMVYKILNIEIAVLLKDSVRQSRHVTIV